MMPRGRSDDAVIEVERRDACDDSWRRRDKKSTYSSSEREEIVAIGTILDIKGAIQIGMATKHAPRIRRIIAALSHALGETADHPSEIGIATDERRTTIVNAATLAWKTASTVVTAEMKAGSANGGTMRTSIIAKVPVVKSVTAINTTEGSDKIRTALADTEEVLRTTTTIIGG